MCSSDLSTTLRIESAGGGTCEIEWIIYEFSAGVTVQHIDTTSPSGVTRDFTISAINLSIAFCIMGIQWGQSFWSSNSSLYWEFTSTTNLRATTGGGTGGSGNGVNGQVIEYSGATVQSADFTVSNLTDTFSITAVDQTKALTITSQHISGAAEASQWDFSNDTTLRSRRGDSSSRDGHYFVVEFPEFEVQRGYENIGSGASNKNISISAVSDLTQSFTTWINHGGATPGDGANNDPEQFMIRSKFNSTTEINIARYQGGNDYDVAWNVFEFVGSAKTPDLTPAAQMSHMA